MQNKFFSSIQSISEGFYLLKKLPISCWLWYYVGTIPFVLLLIQFWTAMVHDTNGIHFLPVYAFTLSVCFIWMKGWHSFFYRSVFQFFSSNDESVKKINLKLVIIQFRYQFWGIFLLPISLLTGFFPIIYTYYQFLSMLGEKIKYPNFRKKVWDYAKQNYGKNLLINWLLNPWQLLLGFALMLVFIPILQEYFVGVPYIYFLPICFLVLFPLNPFGFFVSLNLLLAMMMIPYFLRIFFNIQSMHVIAQSYMIHSTFLVVLAGLTFVILDPFIKVVYALRYFQLQSQTSGTDLIRRLNQLKKIFPIIVFLFLISICQNTLYANNVSPSPDDYQIISEVNELESAIENEINKSEYQWWNEQDKQKELVEKNIFHRIIGSIARSFHKGMVWIKNIIKKIINFFDRRKPASNSTKPAKNWKSNVKILLYVLSAIIIILLIKLLFKINSNTKKSITEQATIVPDQPDINDENIDIEQYEEDDWKIIAKEFLEKGQYGYAIRALHISLLKKLADKHWIRPKKFKSVRDYHREILLQAEKEIATFYFNGMKMYEESWFGKKEMTFVAYEKYYHFYEKINGKITS